jgi:hypothetical protein
MLPATRTSFKFAKIVKLTNYQSKLAGTRLVVVGMDLGLAAKAAFTGENCGNEIGAGHGVN